MSFVATPCLKGRARASRSRCGDEHEESKAGAQLTVAESCKVRSGTGIIQFHFNMIPLARLVYLVSSFSK